MHTLVCYPRVRKESLLFPAVYLAIEYATGGAFVRLDRESTSICFKDTTASKVLVLGAVQVPNLRISNPISQKLPANVYQVT
jgi:hypothetical protein